MDDDKPEGLRAPDGFHHADKPLGRGLGDVSHLFLSQRGPEAAANDPAATRSPGRSSPPPGSRGGITLLRPASVTRDRLAGLLMEFPGALDEGLKAIDTKLSCDPCGEIDLLAVNRESQLTIVDFEITSNDALLVRGLGHFHWVARNMPNVRRMYRDQAINFALQPRLVLLAPQFSPVVRSMARQLTLPHVQWIRYHTVESSGSGPAILFEPVVGD